MSLGGSFGPGGGLGGGGGQTTTVPPPGFSGGASVPAPAGTTQYGPQPGANAMYGLMDTEGIGAGGVLGIFQGEERFAIIRNEALAQQFINEYESGTLPSGVQAAIDQSYQSGLTSLTSNLAAAGFSGPSSLESSGVAELQTQKSIATQAALEQILQQYFQSQGVALQASQQLQQFSEFEQSL